MENKERKTIIRLLGNGMTVADLISELEGLDPEALVGFQSDYGDYTHTQQFLPVGNVEEMAGEVLYHQPGYSRSDLAIREEDEDDTSDLTLEERIEYQKMKAEQEDLPRIVVLS